MIKYLLVRNWRAYEKVALEPEPGLTFVVAENGVGKSSLLQGASWTLFGDQAGYDLNETLRKGEQAELNGAAITGEMAFEVEGRELVVKRSWSPNRRPRESIALEADGHNLDPEGLSALLFKMAGVPQDVLNRLWFVPELRLVEEASLFGDIGNHLRHLLGIDSLEAVAERTKSVATAVGKRASQLKRAESMSQSQRIAAETRMAEGEREVAGIDERLEQIQSTKNEFASELLKASAWERYEAQQEEFALRHAELSNRAKALSVEENLDAVVSEIQESRSTLDQTLANVKAEHALIGSLSEHLSGEAETCPLCLQPITTTQAAIAAETHSHRMGELAAQRDELQSKLSHLAERARQVGEVASAISRLNQPRPPDDARGRDAVSIRHDLEQIDIEIEQVNRRRGELTSELKQLRESLVADESSARAAAQIESLYATEAVANVLSEAARLTAADRVEKAVKPLTQAIFEQWDKFFPGRGRPEISGHGELAVRRGDNEIKYAQLSGGEKVLTGLITRLLFIASATTLDSVWLDEPLEHLDPVNRVRAARLLVEASRPGNRLSQIFVTTYEEALARTLSSRYEHVHVTYVSDDPLA